MIVIWKYLLILCVNCSNDNTNDVICKLLKKYNITDSPSRFVLYERDVLSGKNTSRCMLFIFYIFKQLYKLIL